MLLLTVCQSNITMPKALRIDPSNSEAAQFSDFSAKLLCILAFVLVLHMYICVLRKFCIFHLCIVVFVPCAGFAFVWWICAFFICALLYLCSVLVLHLFGGLPAAGTRAAIMAATHTML